MCMSVEEITILVTKKFQIEEQAKNQYRKLSMIFGHDWCNMIYIIYIIQYNNPLD